MNKSVATSLALALVLVGCDSASNQAPEVAVTTEPAAAHSPDIPEFEAANLTTVVQTYCQVCHNDALRTGNLSLTGFEVENAPEHPETAERMIRKLRAGMMPPPGMPRPVD